MLFPAQQDERIGGDLFVKAVEYGGEVFAFKVLQDRGDFSVFFDQPLYVCYRFIGRKRAYVLFFVRKSVLLVL